MPKKIQNDNVSLSQDKIDKTTGFLNAKVVICRSGIQDYVGSELGLTGDDAGKLFNVLRHPDDVTNDESLATYKNLTITDEHPPERWVDLNNIKEVQRGQVSDVAVDNIDGEVHITGVMSITDESLINKTLNGKVEVSLGYAYELVAEDGVYKGEAYQYKYVNMLANHLSVVDAGRCGPTCHITNDKKYDIIVADKQNDEGVPVKIKINGKEFDVSDEVHEALMAERKSTDADMEETEKKVNDMEEEVEETKTSNDKLTAKVDNLEAKLKTSNDSKLSDTDLSKMVTERAELIAFAKPIIGNDSMPTCPNAIKTAVVSKHFGITLDGKSEAYIAARFEMVEEDMAKQADSLAKLNLDLDTTKQVTNDADKKAAEAREKYMKDRGF